METKHDKHGGNAFLWGLIIGALLTTLLTTKRGRQILRELTNLGLEIFEDFVEERTQDKQAGDSEQKESDLESAGVTQDLESEITEVEAQPIEKIITDAKSGGNGHKRRLFKGIRRK